MTSLIYVTFGALLLGGFCAAALSGVVIVQTFLYIKLFPRDSTRVKAIVGAVWVLDTTHSLLVYASIWIYLITNYGDETKIDTIPIPLALTVIITASVIHYPLVQCLNCCDLGNTDIHRTLFFLTPDPQTESTAMAIYGSHCKHLLLEIGTCGPTDRKQPKLVLAFFRLCCATVTTAEMIHMKTFTEFKANFRWVFTLGLAMSCLVDILVTGFLTHSLQTLQSDKRASTSLDRVIGAVVLYTFETNLLTSAATIVSMICWLTMPNNLVFMGLHFFISKLYANSLLATLNTRKQLQHQRQRCASADLPAGFPRLSTIRRTTGMFSARNELPTATRLEITVEKTVEFGGDEPSPLESFRHKSMNELHSE
ncbi:hypothetical protein HD554DRAFT_2174488 [Boletus coccyginus]|nr:hypothetical protein HD554DRAFT_2174488 [Boletus coccyginus]